MIYKVWKNLLKKKVHLSMEHQIFYSLSIFLFVALFIFLLTSIILEQYNAAYVALLAIIIQIIVFYLVEHDNKIDLAILLFGAYSNILLVANYFFNSGISGPSIIAFLISLFIMLSICKREHMFIFFGINIIIVCIISTAEYNFPNLIQNFYSTKSQLFADNMSTYTICVIFMYLGSVFIRDSYLKERAERVQKTISLEDLNKSKDKLLSIISHDLRSPLASIQQYLELVNQIDLEKEDRKFIENSLLKTTINTQELLNNLLQWSKSQLEGNEVDIKPINIKYELSKTIESMSLLAYHKNITLKSILNESMIIMADANMLQMVIRNLVHNAIKFTQSGGVVEIVTSQLNDKSVITIKDNGVGMDESAQEKVFNLKIESTYGTESENGSGLGLVLCKEYTERQGGEIWFSSKKGEGTVFYVSLPLH